MKSLTKIIHPLVYIFLFAVSLQIITQKREGHTSRAAKNALLNKLDTITRKIDKQKRDLQKHIIDTEGIDSLDFSKM